MIEDQDKFRRFQEFFRRNGENFHIMEQRVPVERQMDYFKYSEKLRRNFPRGLLSEELPALEEELYDPEASASRKRYVLSKLAASCLAKAYRILEAYAAAPEPAMKEWAYMALMECRILLESELSEERQIFISTGLGGRGNKLRFYILILANGLKPFQDYQRNIVEREFPYLLGKWGCEIERLTVGGRSVEMVMLIPVLADIKSVVERVVGECNEYGNFLSSSITITNVKELTEEEVDEIIRENERDNQAGDKV